MKRVLLLLMVAGSALLMSATKSAHGVQFRGEGWSSVSKSAKSAGKPIFVFVRTQSCNISARMDDIFRNPGVADFFNSNFVSLQMDPDKPMDNLRVSNWGATGVPTYVFFDADKNKVHMTRGYKDEKAIVQEAEKALKMMGVAYKKPGNIKPGETVPGDDDEDAEDDE